MTSSGKWLRNSFIWLIVALIIVLVIVLFFHAGSDTTQVNISTILNDIKTDIARNQTDTLLVGSDTITLTRGQSQTKESANINSTFNVTQVLKDNNIDYTNDRQLVLEYDTPSALGAWLSVLGGLLPFLFIGGLLIFMMRQAQGSNNQALSFGKSRARMFTGNKSTVTFSDVAGVEEAKQELQEIVEFLKFPDMLCSGPRPCCPFPIREKHLRFLCLCLFLRVRWCVRHTRMYVRYRRLP